MKNAILYRNHTIKVELKFWLIFPYWKAKVKISEQTFYRIALIKLNVIRSIKRLIDFATTL